MKMVCSYDFDFSSAHVIGDRPRRMKRPTIRADPDCLAVVLLAERQGLPVDRDAAGLLTVVQHRSERFVDEERGLSATSVEKTSRAPPPHSHTDMELRPSKERMYTAAPSGVEGITAHVQDTMRHGSEHMPRNTHHTN